MGIIIMEGNRIAIIDLGGQYTHLICKQINKLGADGYIVFDPKNSNMRKNTRGIILSGGPNSVYDKASPKVPEGIFQLGVPVLGICYGHQLLVHSMGGQVSAGNRKEYGIASLTLKTADTMFKGIKNKRLKVWMSHGDAVSELPPGFEVLASTHDCEFAAIGDTRKRLFGVQFHPEVTHTMHGKKLLRNFLYEICGCVPKEHRISEISKIKKAILRIAADKNIFFLVSGGVDSTVAFKLCSDTLGKNRVMGLCIDTGLMRKNEIKKIQQCYQEIGLTNVHFYNASEIFLNALHGIHDPEEKRKIIGRVFLEVQNDFLKINKIDEKNWILGQGTIYPDTIESGGTKNSALIKTHHNRVDAIERLKKSGRLIEPISSYYKDEVRKLGVELNLPMEIVNRNPFPGPGLAIRCMTSQKSVSKLHLSNQITSSLKTNGYRVWELPHKTVGVQGDSRTLNNAVVIEGSVPHKALENVSTGITNNFLSVNRVTYLLGAKEPIQKATIIESEITKNRLDLLREADHLIQNYFKDKTISKKIWQFPVILLPLRFKDGETIVLRPISSENGMTADFTKIQRKALMEVTHLLLSVKGVDAVLYDITNKPPATIEWE
jgi:GMP synthase (glutamine-hydrolysing)